jgi:hypothetical protein
MNLRALTRYAACGLLMISFALPAHAAGVASCGTHPWLKLPPPGLDADRPVPLYMEVKPALRDEASKMLAQHAGVRLTPKEAERFTGEPAQSWVPGLTFLLRGVRNADPNSRYAATAAFDGEVVIHFASRKAVGEPYSAPMVVVLDQMPTALYITCMAGQ